MGRKSGRGYKACGMTSGKKHLLETLRAQGDLPPPKSELLRQLRKEGKAPRSLGGVARELRKSGVVLPPYDQTSAASPITPAVHAKMQIARDFLNKHLFGGMLGDAFLTFQRREQCFGPRAC